MFYYYFKSLGMFGMAPKSYVELRLKWLDLFRYKHSHL